LTTSAAPAGIAIPLTMHPKARHVKLKRQATTTAEERAGAAAKSFLGVSNVPQLETLALRRGDVIRLDARPGCGSMMAGAHRFRPERRVFIPFAVRRPAMLETR